MQTTCWLVDIVGTPNANETLEMSHNNEILQNLWNLPIRDSKFG